MLMSVVLLSETMVNRETDKEAAFLFFKKEYPQLRALMKRTFVALKAHYIS